MPRIDINADCIARGKRGSATDDPVAIAARMARLQAAHGDKLPWRLLANADRRRWQPLGGWPGDEAPKLSVVGSLEEEEIAF